MLPEILIVSVSLPSGIVEIHAPEDDDRQPKQRCEESEIGHHEYCEKESNSASYLADIHLSKPCHEERSYGGRDWVLGRIDFLRESRSLCLGLLLHLVAARLAECRFALDLFAAVRTESQSSRAPFALACI